MSDYFDPNGDDSFDPDGPPSVTDGGSDDTDYDPTSYDAPPTPNAPAPTIAYGQYPGPIPEVGILDPDAEAQLKTYGDRMAAYTASLPPLPEVNLTPEDMLILIDHGYRESLFPDAVPTSSILQGPLATSPAPAVRDPNDMFGIYGGQDSDTGSPPASADVSGGGQEADPTLSGSMGGFGGSDPFAPPPDSGLAVLQGPLATTLAPTVRDPNDPFGLWSGADLGGAQVGPSLTDQGAASGADALSTGLLHGWRPGGGDPFTLPPTSSGDINRAPVASDPALNALDPGYGAASDHPVGVESAYSGYGDAGAEDSSGKRYWADPHQGEYLPWVPPSPASILSPASGSPSKYMRLAAQAELSRRGLYPARVYADPAVNDLVSLASGQPLPPSQMAPATRDWLAAHAIQTTIDPIPGYDQTGQFAWRAAHDQVFLDAVNTYNAERGLVPWDPGYWTADLLKAQAMRESGGEGDRAKFMVDPLQVNKLGDWDWKTNGKAVHTDLTSADQPMNPALSARAALQWLEYKGQRPMPSGYGAPDQYYHSLYKYNARTDTSKESSPLEHGV